MLAHNRNKRPWTKSVDLGGNNETSLLFGGSNFHMQMSKASHPGGQGGHGPPTFLSLKVGVVMYLGR